LGTSNGKLLDAGTDPGTGTVKNGKTPAGFNGTTEYLQAPVLKSDQFLSPTEYSYVVLVKPLGVPAASAAIGSAYQDGQFICGNASEFGLSWSTTGGVAKVRAWHQDSVSTWPETAKVSLPANTYAMVGVSFKSGALSMSINCGTPVTVATASVLNLDLGQITLGSDGFVDAFAGSDTMEVITSLSDISSSFPSLKAYFNARYALTL